VKRKLVKKLSFLPETIRNLRLASGGAIPIPSRCHESCSCPGTLTNGGVCPTKPSNPEICGITSGSC
jgi:hypothetical protein